MTHKTIKEQVREWDERVDIVEFARAIHGDNLTYYKEWVRGTQFTTQYAKIENTIFDLGTFQSTDKNAMKRARQEFKKELIGEGE